MVARIESRGLALRLPLAKGFCWKMAPGKFDIRRPQPFPHVADLTKDRIQITQDGAGEIRVEKDARDPPHGEIFWGGGRVGIQPRRIRDSASKTRNFGVGAI